jgi:hypothetical protein
VRSWEFDVLAVSTKASPGAATSAGLPTLKAVLAVHRTVASGLEWNRGLLPAARTDHACTLRCIALVSAAARLVSAARLLILLGLAACFAALRRRITAIPEELLILGRKRE